MIYNTNSKNKKMVVWRWIIIYLIAGLIIYGIIYFVLGTKSVSYSPSQNTGQSSPGPSKLNFLTDSKGMSLYIFDKDSKGVSNCTGGCLKIWPPLSTNLISPDLSANITVINRPDGSKQYAWKEMPLYYYASDQKPGDTNGDGIGGIWHLIKL